MADVLTGSPYATKSSARDENAADRRNRTVQRVLLILIAALALALVLELVYHLAVAPRLAITDIEIENGSIVPDQQLLSAAGIEMGMMYFGVNEAELEAVIEAFPPVRSATVEVSFPNRLRVAIAPREALACSLVATDDGLVTVVFDEEGVVFRVESATRSESLPVISGLSYPGAQTGLEIPVLLHEFLADLHLLREDAPELFNLFSEYRVVRKNENAFDVVLYPMHFNVPVRIGRRIDAGMVQYIVMMLEMLRSDGRLAGVEEIDFRTGEGVLRPKEGGRG